MFQRREKIFIAVEKNEKQQKLYDPQKLLIYHQNLISEMRSHYGLPEIYRLTHCTCRKDTQVASMVTSLEKWEEFKNRFTKITSVQQYTQLVMEMTWEYLQPKLEEYYGAKIKFWYLLGPYIGKNAVYAYSVKVFDTPLFRAVDTHQGNTEDKLASMVSGYIRDLSGKGPERVTVAIVDNCYMVVSVSGLIPRYMKDYVCSNNAACLYIQNMMASLLNGAVDYAFQSEYQFVPEKFTEVDFKHNHIITLAIIRPIVDNVI